jgi:hypothetical protein
MGELGAIVGGNDAEQRWKAGDPVIVVHAIASEVREMSRPRLHVVVGIRTSRQQPDWRGEESRPSDGLSGTARGWMRWTSGLTTEARRSS